MKKKEYQNRQLYLIIIKLEHSIDQLLENALMKNYLFCSFTLCSLIFLSACSDSSPKLEEKVEVKKEEMTSLLKEMENTFQFNEVHTTIDLLNGCTLSAVTRTVTNLVSDRIDAEISYEKFLKSSASAGCKDGATLSVPSAVKVVTNKNSNESIYCTKSVSRTGNLFSIVTCKNENLEYDRSRKTLTFRTNENGFSATAVVFAQTLNPTVIRNDLENITIEFATYDEKEDQYTIYKTINNANAVTELALKI